MAKNSFKTNKDAVLSILEPRENGSSSFKGVFTIEGG